MVAVKAVRERRGLGAKERLQIAVEWAAALPASALASCSRVLRAVAAAAPAV